MHGHSLRVGVLPPFRPFYGNQDSTDFITQGFLGTILQQLSRDMNFSIEKIVSDNYEYGICFENGTCNGLIGMLQNDEIDIAAMDISYSYSRRHAVDFLVPFIEEDYL